MKRNDEDELDKLPVFDLAPFLSDSGGNEAEILPLCKSIATTLKETGVLVVRDPRVDATKNDEFLNVMETYFARADTMRDARPELAYQVGLTPEGIEKPRCLNDESMREVIERYEPTPVRQADPKCRYFWRLGERPTATRFKELNADPVVPDGFENWEQVMDGWGYLMLETVETVAEMVALGFGLEKDTFTQRMHLGPHLLAPTGTDLEKYGKVGTVFAGFHNDLNFLTIHGKSKHAGLFIWLRDGKKKIPVKIPDGCLLLQAGKQLEWLTGGVVQAGYHEVVCTEDTLAAMARCGSTWRVSSTVFSQLASDEVLRPLPCFETEESIEKYPPMAVGEFVESELKYINLMHGEGNVPSGRG